MYKPNTPFSAALELFVPTYTKKQGVPVKAFPASGVRFFGSFKTYGGTERDVDGLYSIEDTAVIETWFNPSIKSDCRVKVLQTGNVYEIINEPENVELRNQWLKFKVRRVKGGA